MLLTTKHNKVAEYDLAEWAPSSEGSISCKTENII
jgi:hypothetical protein